MHILRTTIRVVLVFANLSLLSAAVQAQTIWYVDDDGAAANGCTGWADACPELQMALELAGFGDSVWVADGTYRPSNRTDPEDARTATFQLLNGVSIYGGFDGDETSLETRAGLFEQTILTGDLDGDDVGDLDDPTRAENTYHVVTGSDTDRTAVLNGFTITAGNANGPWSTGDSGAGVYCHTGSPTIGRCVLRDNKASVLGGAVHCRRDSDPRIHDCAIFENASSNRGGGIYAFFDSDVLIERCRIFANKARLGGGGVYAEQESNISILDSIIANNHVTDEHSAGGGVLISRSSPQIRRCIILANSAIRSGGGLLLGGSGSSSLLSSSLIAGNWSGGDGGGVYLVLNSATIANCTIAHNIAVNTGGGIFTARNELIIENSILWNDMATQGSELYLFHDDVHNEPADVLVSHSDVAGGPEAVFVEEGSTLIWGPGNLDADPLFAAPDRESYRLLPGSPCIDAGDNTAVPPDTVDQDNDGDAVGPEVLDLDGQSRFIDDPDTTDTGHSDGIHPAVDIGAFEFGCVDFNGDGKVLVCHRSPGHPEHTSELEVSPNAVFSHLSHGDHCGPCGGDCNGNGIPDAEDTADGTSSDCNNNSIPDECEPECNGNGHPDSCDISEGTSDDCNENGVPDECEPDCNDNGQTDACDIGEGSSTDCDDNGVPDECEPDCNSNGQTDACDIAEGESEDCNGNGVPDECEPDCNENDQADECDIDQGLSEDCNLDGVPDDCVPTPLITTQPEDQEAQPGDMVLIGITVEGFVLGYQWRKDGVALVDTDRIIGTNGTLLVILDVEPGDAGVYDCVVTDLLLGCEATSDPATLTVIEPRSSVLHGKP